MTSINLDKFADLINHMRDEANERNPGEASRIQVYGVTGQAGTTLAPDTTYPGLNNLAGPHFHRAGISGDQHPSVGDTWPDCVILQ